MDQLPDHPNDLPDETADSRFLAARRQAPKEANHSTSTTTTCPFSGDFETFGPPPLVRLVPDEVASFPNCLLIMEERKESIIGSSNELALHPSLESALGDDIACLTPVPGTGHDVSYRVAAFNDSTRRKSFCRSNQVAHFDINPKFAYFHAVFAIIRAMADEQEYTLQYVIDIIDLWDDFFDSARFHQRAIFEQSVTAGIIDHYTDMSPDNPRTRILRRLFPARRCGYMQDATARVDEICGNILEKNYDVQWGPCYVPSFIDVGVEGETWGVN